MDPKKVGDFIRQKIGFLDEESSQSRAMCAKLRRAIGKPPGSVPDIWEITLQGAQDEWQSRNDKPSYAEWAIHTTLTLYALHRQGKTGSMNKEGFTFANAIAELVRKDDNKIDAIRRRFNAVATATEFTELSHHARGIIQLLKAEDLHMDYPRFAQDLVIYQYPGGSDRIRLRWGEDFYRALDKKTGKEDE